MFNILNTDATRSYTGQIRSVKNRRPEVDMPSFGLHGPRRPFCFWPFLFLCFHNVNMPPLAWKNKIALVAPKQKLHLTKKKNTELHST